LAFVLRYILRDKFKIKKQIKHAMASKYINGSGFGQAKAQNFSAEDN
jgi:hypothetical protein